MKQQKLNDYKPAYPKKALKGITLAAAALLTIGAVTGCRAASAEPQIDGAIAIDEPGIEETLPPEEIRTDGIVAPEEMPAEEPEEVQLMGDVMVLDLPDGDK